MSSPYLAHWTGSKTTPASEHIQRCLRAERGLSCCDSLDEDVHIRFGWSRVSPTAMLLAAGQPEPRGSRGAAVSSGRRRGWRSYQTCLNSWHFYVKWWFCYYRGFFNLLKNIRKKQCKKFLKSISHYFLHLTKSWWKSVECLTGATLAGNYWIKQSCCSCWEEANTWSSVKQTCSYTRLLLNTEHVQQLWCM